MARKFVTPARLQELIALAIAGDPRCAPIRLVGLLMVDEPGAANWTVTFHFGADEEAAKAMAGILHGLSADYDVAWQTRH